MRWLRERCRIYVSISHGRHENEGGLTSAWQCHEIDQVSSIYAVQFGERTCLASMHK